MCIDCNIYFQFINIIFLFIVAYRYESTLYNLTLDYFTNKSEDIAWFIPVLVRISNDLRIISQQVIMIYII
jgi:hypothetical protein